MSTNKHATIRYHALDQCFGNFGKRYFIEDLVEACNKAIYEYTGIKDGVKKRQVFEDLKFMESDQGWEIPLDRIKNGKRVFYRYSDKLFSIKNQPINETETRQLADTISILSRFKGMPQFEWIEEMAIRLQSNFNIGLQNQSIVSFEQNPYLLGLNYFTDLFNAIQNKRVLQIEYKGFNQLNPIKIVLHPYYLKQYNSRWFLFGFNPEFKTISNLALDRILGIEETNKKYRINDTINFDEYFEDLVGVTKISDQKTETILLRVNPKLWPYIETKPIHGSQKVRKKEDSFMYLELNLVINFELISLIFSYGEGITVVEPNTLREQIKKKADALMKNYI